LILAQNTWFISQKKFYKKCVKYRSYTQQY